MEEGERIKMKVNEIVTKKILDRLEDAKKGKGCAPWQQPWGASGNGDFPRNGISNKSYSGINLMLLDWGEKYYTFNQVQEKKWKIKKGSKASIVVFFTMIDKKTGDKTDDPIDRDDKIPILKYYNIFRSADIEGAPQPEPIEHKTIAEAEEIALNYTEVPVYHSNASKAFYKPSEDYINVPSRQNFPVLEEYYSTLFHEIAHSTGHESRLRRDMGNVFGDHKYSFEELIAEICAAFLCAKCGIVQTTFDNSVAYIDYWLGQLKKDKNMIIRASAKAQRAFDYILKNSEEITA